MKKIRKLKLATPTDPPKVRQRIRPAEVIVIPTRPPALSLARALGEPPMLRPGLHLASDNQEKKAA